MTCSAASDHGEMPALLQTLYRSTDGALRKPSLRANLRERRPANAGLISVIGKLEEHQERERIIGAIIGPSPITPLNHLEPPFCRGRLVFFFGGLRPRFVAVADNSTSK